MKALLLAALLAVPAAAMRTGAPAPSLAAAGVWLNGGRAPDKAELAGRPVVLYFWSFGCARCLTLLETIQRAEAGEPAPTLFIGVHSGRTPREKDARAVREAVIGLNVTHRTADDGDGRLAAAYGVDSLPAVFVLGPDGMITARWNGDVQPDVLKSELARVRAEGAPHGLLAPDRAPEPPLERDAQKEPALLRPSGLAAKGRRLYVSDTGRHRILELDLRGRLMSVLGTGARGYADGPAAKAMFDRPGALFAGDAELFVAELGGLIRKIDLETRAVTTLDYDGVKLPLGVASSEGRVFAASGALNRIYWKIPRTLAFSIYAGAGDGSTRDGSLAAAGFSSPWALAISSNVLYVADASSSAVRAIDLSLAEVRTLFMGAPLSRPVALAYSRGKLYAADAETGAIIEVENAKTGPSCGGFEGPLALAALEDGRLAVAEAGGRLFLLEPSSCAKTELAVKAPARAGPPEPPLPERAELKALEFKVRAGALKVRVDAALPEGMKLNPRSRLRWRVAEAAGPLKFDDKTRKGTLLPPKLPVTINIQAGEGRGELALEADFYYCAKSLKGVCRARAVRVVVGLEASKAEKARSVDVVIPAD